ncbi:hypothetical protein [Helicobacter labetoulli]|uniref:hypothetical protein n=1 Tax=Helicobacter labetoulli TaxID=2315333 RepID=UPI001300991E|nr:hypothetical protein [Helicobacter labetoulli]
MNNATGINKLDFLVENLVKKINSKGEINKDEAMIIIDEVLAEGEKVAKKVAEDSAATKDFVRAEIAEAKLGLKQDIAGVKQEIVEVKADLLKWFVGTQIAVGGFVVALIKLL